MPGGFRVRSGLHSNGLEGSIEAAPALPRLRESGSPHLPSGLIPLPFSLLSRW
jgi:hypothetical protein